MMGLVRESAPSVQRRSAAADRPVKLLGCGGTGRRTSGLMVESETKDVGREDILMRVSTPRLRNFREVRLIPTDTESVNTGRFQ